MLTVPCDHAVQEEDDYLHDPDAPPSKYDQKGTFARGIFGRGLLNSAMLLVLIGGVLGLFMAWPILTYSHRIELTSTGWGYGGING